MEAGEPVVGRSEEDGELVAVGAALWARSVGWDVTGDALAGLCVGLLLGEWVWPTPRGAKVFGDALGWAVRGASLVGPFVGKPVLGE